MKTSSFMVTVLAFNPSVVFPLSETPFLGLSKIFKMYIPQRIEPRLLPFVRYQSREHCPFLTLTTCNDRACASLLRDLLEEPPGRQYSPFIKLFAISQA